MTIYSVNTALKMLREGARIRALFWQSEDQRRSGIAYTVINQQDYGWPLARRTAKRLINLDLIAMIGVTKLRCYYALRKST